jgi:catechol 1,2-dioxygenase
MTSNPKEPAMEPNERLMAIYNRTVEALKEVVREFAVTEDELHVSGRYLNRLGQSGMCPSLLDVALAMTSIAASGRQGPGTRICLEGPYHGDHPVRADGDILERAPAAGGSRLTLTGVVTDAVTGAPIPGARLDFWQADADGLYDKKGAHLRGVVLSDAQGGYELKTVVPSDYAEHDHDPIGELFRAMGKPNTRAAHIHLKVSVASEELLTTQLFMPTSSFLDRDYVEGAVSEDLTLVLEPDGEACRSRFDIAVAPAVVPA